ncbi:GNAT family N-acetyltransferase [Nocardioides solisilvae]|uniref:GNAT family N-acetyltransferase n=1 Tax=Nocardioides solisilvae TaxID=1542435 RepID=UPI000D74D0B5|nr:GNAT family N-acetyltransferase [Nocardioides solisilvae]
MDLSIAPADLDSPELEAFVVAHLAELEHTAPEESRHAKPLIALQEAAARVWVAGLGGRLVGMVALAPVEPLHEEVKSMRTDPALRGRGIGRRLLDHVLENAHVRDVERVSLETGSAEFFAPARRLYASAGFEPCGPFGGYVEDPHSVFMTRPA